MLLKFHQFYGTKNIRSDTHKTRKPFSPNWKQQKNHILNRKPFKKIEEKIFSKKFLMKVFGKSHSLENPEESFMLVKRFVSRKIEEGGLRWKQIRKNSQKKNGYSVLGLRKFNSRRKLLILKKNSQSRKLWKVNPLRFSNIHSVAKHTKK